MLALKVLICPARLGLIADVLILPGVVSRCFLLSQYPLVIAQIDAQEARDVVQDAAPAPAAKDVPASKGIEMVSHAYCCRDLSINVFTVI
jgi:hypothetical protein